MSDNSCQRMCHFGLSLPISLKPVGGIPSHLGHNTLGEKVCYCQSLPSNGVLLGASYLVFIDEHNPSKISKMVSNSFEVTDVPLPPLRYVIMHM